jgi:GNAT superfamily N-acetyltransferase
MNFYSDQIINNIVDNHPIEKILDEIDTFKLQCKYVLTKYSAYTIYHKYIDWLLNDPKPIIAFYCLDQEFDIYNCPSMLVYRKVSTLTENRYYILLTCTKRNFRGQGYATKLLDEFKKRIACSQIPTKIILSSVEDAVVFYEDYGFKWTRESIKDHPILLQYEFYEEKKHYFIMELELCA